MAKAEIPEGTRAIIELTAERAADQAITKHEAKCSIRPLWKEHDGVKRRVRVVELTIAATVGVGGIGGGIWALVRTLGG